MNIKFINHSSILLEENGAFFLTDPWYIAPAFGGWTQSPSPKLEAIQNVLSIPQDKLHVIISHGHDDHLDEFFVSKHLSRAQFFVPKFRTNGLSLRIARLTGRDPQELDEFGSIVQGVGLRCFINPEFTQYDAIISFRGHSDAVIHANDNWHEYSDGLARRINESLTGISQDNRYLFIQFGIADSFPINYRASKPGAASSAIQARFEQYRNSTEANLRKLGLLKGYYYANQSIYDYPEPWAGQSLYSMAQAFLDAVPSPFTQCQSGTDIKSGSLYVKSATNLFSHLLAQLEMFLNRAVGCDPPLKLLLPGASCDNRCVAYEATRLVWTRILCGELTLEAITIGGMGVIYKPPERNISDIHHKISKLAYVVQSKIVANGLEFLLSEP